MPYTKTKTGYCYTYAEGDKPDQEFEAWHEEVHHEEEEHMKVFMEDNKAAKKADAEFKLMVQGLAKSLIKR